MTKRELERRAKKELGQLAEAYLILMLPNKLDSTRIEPYQIRMLRDSLYRYLTDEGDDIISDIEYQYELEQGEKREKEKARKT